MSMHDYSVFYFKERGDIYTLHVNDFYLIDNQCISYNFVYTSLIFL